MDTTQLLDAVLRPLTNGYPLLIAAVLLVNWVLGVLVAIREGVFEWKRVADWLTGALLKLGGYMLISVAISLATFRELPESFARQVIEAGGTNLTLGGILTAAAAEIADKVKRLGVPMPAPLPPSASRPGADPPRRTRRTSAPSELPTRADDLLWQRPRPAREPEAETDGGNSSILR